ncbi:MAG: hypothetical protein DRQ49_07285 [Gammaproteobacteria bacterium]|nr:MAG: hypothetical protein DRQ41_14385 [Gammaproteobacteria bacterium]RKZ40776.1 MAG: hypothetical protein DRQ49_07285 [Gammaproteobacteria bacterium]RKZ72085.1 MAG: hypothetical protein DRQ57_17840 [Gammaproteobacteria bacterium]
MNVIAKGTDTIQHGFFIAIGSNIQPPKNFPLIMAKLVAEFGKLWLSRVIYTTPVDMTSKSLFLNAVLYLKSELSSDKLKKKFNSIETALGRDRSNPQRNIKDRTADIDILFSIPLDEMIDSDYQPNESHLRLCFVELATVIGKYPSTTKVTNDVGVKLQIDGQIFGHAPCLISYQASANKIAVEVL